MEIEIEDAVRAANGAGDWGSGIDSGRMAELRFEGAKWTAGAVSATAGAAS